MKTPPRKGSLGRLVAALLLTAAQLVGCSLGSFQRPSPDAVWLGMQPRMPQGGLRAGGPTLQVLPFGTVGPFRTDRLAARGSGDLWEFSHYHRWLAEPGEMVSTAAAQYLARCDLFAAVSSAGGTFEPEYRLGGSVRELYWDRRAGRLVLEVEGSLVAYPAEFRGFWIHRAEAPVAGNDLPGLPPAASAALEQILSDFRKDLNDSLGTLQEKAGAPPGRREGKD